MSAPVTLPSLVVGTLTRLTYYLKFAAPRELSIKQMSERKGCGMLSIQFILAL
jgi:hypothetical protein